MAGVASHSRTRRSAGASTLARRSAWGSSTVFHNGKTLAHASFHWPGPPKCASSARAAKAMHPSAVPLSSASSRCAAALLRTPQPPCASTYRSTWSATHVRTTPSRSRSRNTRSSRACAAYHHCQTSGVGPWNTCRSSTASTPCASTGMVLTMMDSTDWDRLVRRPTPIQAVRVDRRNTGCHSRRWYRESSRSICRTSAGNPGRKAWHHTNSSSRRAWSITTPTASAVHAWSGMRRTQSQAAGTVGAQASRNRRMPGRSWMAFTGTRVVARPSWSSGRVRDAPRQQPADRAAVTWSREPHGAAAWQATPPPRGRCDVGPRSPARASG